MRVFGDRAADGRALLAARARRRSSTRSSRWGRRGRAPRRTMRQRVQRVARAPRAAARRRGSQCAPTPASPGRRGSVRMMLGTVLTSVTSRRCAHVGRGRVRFSTRIDHGRPSNSVPKISKTDVERDRASAAAPRELVVAEASARTQCSNDSRRCDARRQRPSASAGRAGRVDDVGEVVGRAAAAAARAERAVARAAQSRSITAQRVRSGSAVPAALVRQQHRDARVVQHEAQALFADSRGSSGT